VHNKDHLRLNRLGSNNTMQVNNKNSNIEWRIPLRNTILALILDNCIVVVDSSFFLETLDFTSTYWIFVIDNYTIGKGGFVVKVSKDLQLVFIEEVCSRL